MAGPACGEQGSAARQIQACLTNKAGDILLSVCQAWHREGLDEAGCATGPPHAPAWSVTRQKRGTIFRENETPRKGRWVENKCERSKSVMPERVPSGETAASLSSTERGIESVGSTL